MNDDTPEMENIMKNWIKILLLSILFIVFQVSISPVFSEEAILEAARRHLVRAKTAIKMAQKPADFHDAIVELEKAAQLAPKWADTAG